MDLSNSLFDVKGLNIKSNNNLKDSSTIFSSSLESVPLSSSSKVLLSVFNFSNSSENNLYLSDSNLSDIS